MNVSWQKKSPWQSNRCNKVYLNERCWRSVVVICLGQPMLGDLSGILHVSKRPCCLQTSSRETVEKISHGITLTIRFPLFKIDVRSEAIGHHCHIFEGDGKSQCLLALTNEAQTFHDLPRLTEKDRLRRSGDWSHRLRCTCFRMLTKLGMTFL